MIFVELYTSIKQKNTMILISNYPKKIGIIHRHISNGLDDFYDILCVYLIGLKVHLVRIAQFSARAFKTSSHSKFSKQINLI